MSEALVGQLWTPIASLATRLADRWNTQVPTAVPRTIVSVRHVIPARVEIATSRDLARNSATASAHHATPAAAHNLKPLHALPLRIVCALPVEYAPRISLRVVLAAGSLTDNAQTARSVAANFMRRVAALVH